GGDLLADRVLGRGLAGAHGGAVEMHGAGAAEPCAATELGACHLQMLADDPQQGRVVVDIDLLGLAVDGECDHVSSVAVRLVSLEPTRASLGMRTLLFFVSWQSVMPIVHSARNGRQGALFDIPATAWLPDGNQGGWTARRARQRLKPMADDRGKRP